MSCDYPLKCQYWSDKQKKEQGHGCILTEEEFEKLVQQSNHPCSVHQQDIDTMAERDYAQAYREKDEETMRAIKNSPFTNFKGWE